MILEDINLTGHSVFPLRCFPLGNFDCNDDCLDCFIYHHFDNMHIYTQVSDILSLLSQEHM